MRDRERHRDRTDGGPHARRRARAAWFVSIVLLLAGCLQTDPAPAAEAPAIEAFSASPQTSTAGSSVTLAWSVTGAETLRLRPGDLDVSGRSSIAVAPTATTTYTLIAENDSGTTARATEVVVEPVPLPAIERLTASPGTVTAGSASTLSWTVTGADAVRLEPLGVAVAASSSRSVTPATTTSYQLIASNEAGAVSRAVTVTVEDEPPPPPLPVIDVLTVSPGTIIAGSSATLSWSVRGADELRLDPPGEVVTGASSFVVTPTGTTTYQLTASNEAGAVTRSVTVTVELPPPLPLITSFAASPRTVASGASSTLSWSSVGANTVRLEPLGIDVAAAGSRVVTPTATTTYHLTATNETGDVSRTVTVTVEDVEPPPPDDRVFSVLVVGQSNAQGVNIADPVEARAFIDAADGVMMLGNDGVWKAASEPLDDCVDQEDTVSMDPSTGCDVFSDNNSGVSFGVSLGNELTAVTDDTVYLIPAAKGGSSLAQWLQGLGTEDRDTLFGSAVVRARLAGSDRDAPLDRVFDGDPYGAVVWFQGETDTSTSSLASDYADKTDDLLDGFVSALDAPIILVQLARRGKVDGSDEVSRNLLYQIVREQQRRMAEGARLPNTTGSMSPLTRAGTHLVVTHDLPMADGRHLSAAGPGGTRSAGLVGDPRASVGRRGRRLGTTPGPCRQGFEPHRAGARRPRRHRAGDGDRRGLRRLLLGVRRRCTGAHRHHRPAPGRPEGHPDLARRERGRRGRRALHAAVRADVGGSVRARCGALGLVHQPDAGDGCVSADAGVRRRRRGRHAPAPRILLRAGPGRGLTPALSSR